ncbi:lysine--tRNA ligase [Candidatus Woesebacteria bacterium]|nr:lysine--tRNA ligase [Candidatus Woesebacteria bacterium]
MSRIDEAISAKKEKRQSLESLGVVAHPYSFDKKQTVAQSLQSIGQQVQTAGRLTALRLHGKVNFGDLHDHTGTIQVMFRESELGTDVFNLFKFIDAGDYLGVTGEVIVSKTGETTIHVQQCTFLGKSLRPIPTEWNAADDKEARFRKRYLDILINPNTKRVLDARWTIEREIRRYLQDTHDFIEVETPIFQPLYGGTNAKPFTTHMNALDVDFYLRLAPELYLKRLIVAGYEKIFEIARNFRNEGIDQTHQPEFTMIEWYEAYADYNKVMSVAEGLLKHLAHKLYGKTTIMVDDKEIDLGGTWPKYTMVEALKLFANIDFENLSDQELQHEMKQRNIEIIGEFTRGKAQFALFDKLVPEFLLQPTWIIDYPRDISPLAKAHRKNPLLAERFEVYIGGREIADGWSEITDAIDQRNIFAGEQKRMRAGDAEAHPMDEDFLEAMEYGMPPLGGIGMGIDRLVMFLTNTWSIKEVIAFPTLRPIRPLTTTSTPEAPKAAASVAPAVKAQTSPEEYTLPSREATHRLLDTYIKNEALKNHCIMVARAMEAYAKELGEDPELWYQTGLLHDLDWEMYPDEHPNKAIAELFTQYPQALKDAVAAHAPSRTGKTAQTPIEAYLFATDELSGLMNAISLMRPNGFSDMEVKSVKKKLKDKAFAANVSRDDITQGMALIGKTEDDHIAFLIDVFKSK